MKKFFLVIALAAIGGTLSGCMGMGMGVATTGGHITYIDPCAIAYDQNGRAYTPLNCQGRFNQRFVGNNFGGFRGNNWNNRNNRNDRNQVRQLERENNQLQRQNDRLRNKIQDGRQNNAAGRPNRPNRPSRTRTGT